MLLASIVCLSLVSCDKDEVSEKEDDSPNEDIYKGRSYVDLGLRNGLKWATCNVGAEKPEDYGDYFAWGETSPKDDYSWKTYKYCNGTDDFLTKYYVETISRFLDGTIDNKTFLESTDDAASVNWGGSWRMPTHAEWRQISSQCYWEFVESYENSGVSGWVVYKAKAAADKGLKYSEGTSTTPTEHYSVADDVHIFLPLAKYIHETTNDSYPGGFYWSSSLYVDAPNWAKYACLSRGGANAENSWPRSFGMTVRAVCP